MYRGCNACSPPGTIFSSEVGNADADKCRNCPTGYFQRQEAQTNCTACPKGTTTNGRNGPPSNEVRSADSAPTARARNATRDALPTPEAAPSAPSASPAKLPILRARRAIIRLGLRRRIALSASISTTERTSRSGAAKHVPREYPVEGRSRGAESNKLPSCSDGRAARPATFLP